MKWFCLKDGVVKQFMKSNFLPAGRFCQNPLSGRSCRISQQRIQLIAVFRSLLRGNRGAGTPPACSLWMKERILKDIIKVAPVPNETSLVRTPRDRL
jgi:hypothetical protein